MSKTAKYLLIIVGVLIAIAIIGKKMGWLGKKTGIKVTIEKTLNHTIEELVSASGKIQPELEVKISPDVSGEITELYVKEGQYVNKGDLLFKIRPDLYETSVNRANASLNMSQENYKSAQARLNQAKASFTNTETIFNRSKKLFDQGVISQAEFDNTKAQYDGAKADLTALEANIKNSFYNINSSQATVKEANDNLIRTLMYAPVSGTISKLNVKKGERVVGTSQMAGTEVMRIANLTSMEVNADINENDIVKLNLNDSATVEVDAYPNVKFRGIVTEIANSANTQNMSADAVTNYAVKVRILPESYVALTKGKTKDYSPFRPSMSATVDIKTNIAPNTLAVKIQSVIAKTDSVETDKKVKPTNGDDDDNSKEETTGNDVMYHFVFIKSADTVIMQRVIIGIQDNEYIQIKSGIKLNDEVVTAPYNAISKMLKSGKQIQVVNEDELYNQENEN